MIRIVHVIFSFHTGGAELMLIDILNEQAKSNDVTLLIINDYDKKIFLDINPNVKILCANRKVGSRNPFQILKLNYLIFTINPDIIHCHNVNMENIIWGKKKILLTVHTTGVKSNMLHKYTKICSISKAVKKDIQTRFNADSILVYNGVNSSGIMKKRDTNSETFKIVQIGRLESAQKGQDLLLKAFCKITQNNNSRKISLHFIGSGSSKEYLEELSEKLGVKDNVFFLGLKGRDYIYENLQRYDLLVQPSLQEGFGLTIAEAMLAKVPVLISDCDGPMEVIENGLYGSYFKKGDIEVLANELMKAINSPESKVEEAYEYAKENFNVKNTAIKYLNIYKELINENK